MTIAAGPCFAAVERVAGARLESQCNGLTIVVAESAEDRPADASRIHGLASVIKLLAEVLIHAGNDVKRQRQSEALCRCRILPGKVARRVALDRRALIDFPEII